jgi:hypothetical protein
LEGRLALYVLPVLHIWGLSVYQVLNVEVPFYFKSIVDSMNVDFTTVGGTAWTVAGSMIVACMLEILSRGKYITD